MGLVEFVDFLGPYNRKKRNGKYKRATKKDTHFLRESRCAVLENGKVFTSKGFPSPYIQADHRVL